MKSKCECVIFTVNRVVYDSMNMWVLVFLCCVVVAMWHMYSICKVFPNSPHTVLHETQVFSISYDNGKHVKTPETWRK